MKNITITLDEGTAAWVRRQASGKGVSVSRYVGDLLQQQMLGRSAYEEAMRRFLSKAPVRLSATDERYPTRDETHDRTRLRR